MLIGVEGYGGAGKTTFASQLADALKSAYVVHMDDFIVKENLMEPSWDSGAFDWERLERQILLPVHAGHPACYQRLVWETNSLTDMIAVPEVDYLIVEGISAYHPSIEQYYDYKIWVETPLKSAKQRGSARDGSNENSASWDVWARNDIAYQHMYHPERRADYIFDKGPALTSSGN